RRRADGERMDAGRRTDPADLRQREQAESDRDPGVTRMQDPEDRAPQRGPRMPLPLPRQVQYRRCRQRERGDAPRRGEDPESDGERGDREGGALQGPAYLQLQSWRGIDRE